MYTCVDIYLGSRASWAKKEFLGRTASSPSTSTSFTYIYIYIYIFIYLSIYLSIYQSIYLSIYSYQSIYPSIYLSIYLSICIYTYIYIYIYLYQFIHIKKYIYIHICIYIYIYIYMCVYIYIYIYIYIYVFICLYKSYIHLVTLIHTCVYTYYRYMCIQIYLGSRASEAKMEYLGRAASSPSKSTLSTSRCSFVVRSATTLFGIYSLRFALSLSFAGVRFPLGTVTSNRPVQGWYMRFQTPPPCFAFAVSGFGSGYRVQAWVLRVEGSAAVSPNHSVDFGPFIKSQSASRNQLQGQMWCKFHHVTFGYPNERNLEAHRVEY